MDTKGEPQRIDTVDYFHALDHVINNSGRFQRTGWDASEFILLVEPSEDYESFVAFKKTNGKFIPYASIADDQKASDWQPVKT